MTDKWPSIPGRYEVGNIDSPVAVCTLKDVDIKIPMDKVAISGICFTENVGIERVIKNLISNPKIRFLVLCGAEPKGHFVGQAFKCIKENGVDNGKIIGAMGAMPFLKNVTKEEIERFKEQIEIVDLIEVADNAKIEQAIDECLKKNPGAFEDRGIRVDETETIIASVQENGIKLDSNGWFVINLDREKKRIIAEHYIGYGNEAKLQRRIVGKTPEEIAATITRLGLVSDLYHAAYLGKELQKAEIALKTGKEYEQDKPLNIC